MNTNKAVNYTLRAYLIGIGKTLEQANDFYKKLEEELNYTDMDNLNNQIIDYLKSKYIYDEEFFNLLLEFNNY